MKVVINQSNYIPWKGYFDLIHDADLFIFLDDVQFTKNDWRNRNQIKTAAGPAWLSIPVGKDQNRLINEVMLPNDSAWGLSHWGQLTAHYREAPHFSRLESFLKDALTVRRWQRLSELNRHLIEGIAREFLGIRTRFEDSAQFGVTSHKQDRVMELLAKVGATTYLSGPAARDYLDEARFQEAGVQLVWKDYSGYPEYPQFHPPFLHAVTILDLLFHTGPAAADSIWGWRSDPSVA